MQRIVSMINTPCKQAPAKPQENLNVLERINVEKLGMIVNGSIKAVSVMNNITRNDVLGILGKIHVTTICGVQKAVENLEGIESVDVIRLAVGIEETIKSISDMTNLNAGEITEIFTKKDGAPVEDIVSKLYAKSKAVRSSRT